MPACEEDGMIESQLQEKKLLVTVKIHQYILKALLCHKVLIVWKLVSFYVFLPFHVVFSGYHWHLSAPVNRA